MVTFSKPISANEPQGNGPQEIKPFIPLEQTEPQELVKGEYYICKLHTMPYNSNLPAYNLAVPFFGTRTVEEWLKFLQNLQLVIAGQNITDVQGTCTITKSLLQGDTLPAFKDAEGNNRLQTKPNYEKTTKDVHLHMFPP
eukprot:10649844-Ditylum_brightwellii.AAC.1